MNVTPWPTEPSDALAPMTHLSSEQRAKFNRLFAAIQEMNRTRDPAKIAATLMRQDTVAPAQSSAEREADRASNRDG